MRYGHSMGYGFYGFDWLIIILVIGLITLYVFAVISKNNVSRSYSRFLDILNERYARGEINSDDYNERKDIIENTESADLAIQILLERYAKGKIDSKEFCTIKNEIENKNKVSYINLYD